MVADDPIRLLSQVVGKLARIRYYDEEVNVTVTRWRPPCLRTEYVDSLRLENVQQSVNDARNVRCFRGTEMRQCAADFAGDRPCGHGVAPP